jgi:hypothetical protein
VRTPASFAAGRAILTRLRVSPRQYQLLVDLFESLSERKEIFGSLGLDRHAMRLTALMLLLPGALFALMAFGSAPLAVFNIRVLAFSTFLILLLIVMEAANSFFNPGEVAVLAHQPIGNATYIAAKATYLVLVVLRAATALNGPAALAGLVKDDARWFYPITHLLAAYGAGLFAALLACAAFGVLFRLVPPSRVRSMALWVQILVVMLPMFLDLGARAARRLVASVIPVASGIDWSFVPVTWFSALAVAGQSAPAVALRWPALLGLALSAIFIVYGVRSLSAGYLTRIVGVLRSARKRRRGAHRSSTGGRIVRALTGRPSGQAAYAFLLPMMRRDWQFRRAAVQAGLLLLLGGPAVILSGRSTPPFGADRLPLVGLLPEFLPLFTLVVCSQLAFSDHYRAGWIFATAPGVGRQGYVRGTYWTIWLPFVALPFAAALCFFGYYWGPGDAALFAVYGVAVSSLLLAAQLLFVDGLPFGRPPQAERSFVLLPFLIFGPVVIGIAWVLQGQFVFRSRWTTGLATLVFAGLAVLMARFSLRVLDVRVRRDLKGPSDASMGLFGREASERT